MRFCVALFCKVAQVPQICAVAGRAIAPLSGREQPREDGVPVTAYQDVAQSAGKIVTPQSSVTR
jgi:hypothetical protein